MISGPREMLLGRDVKKHKSSPGLKAVNRENTLLYKAEVFERRDPGYNLTEAPCVTVYAVGC